MHGFSIGLEGNVHKAIVLLGITHWGSAIILQDAVVEYYQPLVSCMQKIIEL